MERIRLATVDEASYLIDLYCKALKVAAMDGDFCAAENRDEAIEWLQNKCREGKIRVAHNGDTPFALLHHEPETSEIITVVVRDDMERIGIATKLIQNLQKGETLLKGIPVTKGGMAVLRRCGFASKDTSDMHWYWTPQP